jgi:ribosomal protein S18 acetylase RimI-like enzyme
MRQGITLRAATASDYDFMRALYGSVRAEEMARFPFGEVEKKVFLDQQFAAQSAHYAQHYPTARFNIIEREGVPIGRLYVDVWPSQIRIVDIALVPEQRRGGIGTSLLLEIMEEGRAAGKAVTIHVETFNDAMRLYKRLGFRHVDTNGVYHLMEWKAPEGAGQVNTAS